MLGHDVIDLKLKIVLAYVKVLLALASMCCWVSKQGIAGSGALTKHGQRVVQKEFY